MTSSSSATAPLIEEDAAVVVPYEAGRAGDPLFREPRLGEKGPAEAFSSDIKTTASREEATEAAFAATG